ncbi:MAG: hypothetical protein UX44_C0026G0005 [candidate division WWE3 bacterium GW2011_GWA1_46_21]|uniref:Cell division protein FtsL n=3 Tax=Katanobacteria TaxID=422282 RepID=A0A0G1SAC3_UNCKA|nr:MAG: hypothetical protein UX44_C0026G0005 [candidate division WWE3 bacterium GW2011_GWA1_46_21]KKU50935.1 MAG: hypothetical protein UX73_C0011G0005 [candidate division WWE3 bacterium GW2011_GWC1_47_10]KKU57441.1 MAG: hypothetical protein UX79_C0011G0005 [candidate division WWE3 bacterium GW2011_GWB1_47_11]
MKKTHRSLKFATVFSFVLLVLSICAQVFVANKAAVKGMEISGLEQRRAELTRDTTVLQLNLANLASLAYVETEASKMGFVHGTASVAVIGAVAVAAISASSF